MALRKPQTEQQVWSPSAREGARDPRRWIIPVAGGILAALLVVVATPHAPWFLRLFLGLIALAYVTGQSAAYLWTKDQG